jgi:hypothetical protein
MKRFINHLKMSFFIMKKKQFVKAKELFAGFSDS